MDRRFFHLLGASKLDRTICSMAGTVGMRMTVGANIGADGEGIPRERPRAAVGNEHAHVESAPLAVRARGARRTARGSSASIRSARAPMEQCDEWLPIRPGHRRGARARHDARDVRRGARGPRLPRALHVRRRPAARARARVSAGARRADHRARRPNASSSSAREFGRATRRVHPRELRAAAPRRRRHGRAHDRLPAGGRPALASAGRRRAALDERELPVQQGARSSDRTSRRRFARST